MRSAALPNDCHLPSGARCETGAGSEWLGLKHAEFPRRTDRKKKIPLYARAGIPEYWILNLIRRTLEVYREPLDAAYLSRAILRAGDTVSPLARPEVRVTVGDLLP